MLPKLRALAGAFCLLAGAGVAHAQDDDGPSVDDVAHITVVGTATARVVPDVVTIRLRVSSEKPTAAEAWDADAKAARAVIDAAKQAGVKPQAIGTTDLDLFQQFDNVRQPDGTTRREAHGFRASQGLRVELTDFTKIGDLTGAMIAAGANSFEGVSFSVGNADAVKDRLRGEALRDARHQAELLAATAGLRLGRLLKVEPPDHPAPTSPQVSRFAAGPSTMPVEPGTQTLSAEVEATYAIE